MGPMRVEAVRPYATRIEFLLDAGFRAFQCPRVDDCLGDRRITAAAKPLVKSGRTRWFSHHRSRDLRKTEPYLT